MITELGRRRAIVLLALAGLFLSIYLFLYALGFYGELACGAGGSCDLVQGSQWARFLGFPVAGWGVGWYAAVLSAAILGATSSEGRGPAALARWVSPALAVMSTGGIVFSGYLTALELWVIHAFCRWCVASAVITLAIFVLSLPEFSRLRR